jgi:hypothetical protein
MLDTNANKVRDKKLMEDLGKYKAKAEAEEEWEKMETGLLFYNLDID